MSDNKKATWFSSDFLRAAPEGEVNEDRGIIERVSVCTVGEVEGHGVHIDSEFIERVAELGSEKKQGLKARFGHPNMCSTALGTFIGRFKNFAVDGDQVRADLCLSNAASDTPHGDLRAYVLNMAKEEPDMFGTSIVFTPGRAFQRNDKGEKEIINDWEADSDRPVFVECDALHACDTVDEPAANDGLFSAFSGETIAGQITEFLDLNPHIFEAVTENPEILDALSKHGDKLDEFFSRYRASREQSKESDMDNKKTKAEVESEALAAKEAEELKLNEEAEAAELATKEAAEKEAAELAEKEEAERLAAGKNDEDSQFSRNEFNRITDEFGAEVAAQTVKDGGDYGTALELHAKQLAEKNSKQAERIVELEAAQTGGKPAAAGEAKETKGLFNTKK